MKLFKKLYKVRRSCLWLEGCSNPLFRVRRSCKGVGPNDEDMISRNRDKRGVRVWMLATLVLSTMGSALYGIKWFRKRTNLSLLGIEWCFSFMGYKRMVRGIQEKCAQNGALNGREWCAVAQGVNMVRGRRCEGLGLVSLQEEIQWFGVRRRGYGAKKDMQ